MPELNRQSEVDLGFDLTFEKRWYAFERALRWVLAFVLVAGVLGAFGRGMLSNRDASSQGARVKYERLLHYKTPSNIELQVPSVNGEARIEFCKDAAQKLGLSQTTPLPSENAASSETGPMIFRADPGQQTVAVHAPLQPSSLGPVHCTLKINGNDAFTIDQFIVP